MANRSLRRIRRWIFVFGSTVWSAVQATDLEISVTPDNRTEVDTVCKLSFAGPCASDLVTAVAMLHDKGWQTRMAGRYGRVRLSLGPGRYALSAPLVIRWGSGATAGVPLEIIGDGADTLLSGAMRLSGWRRAASADFSGRVAPAAMGKLLAAKVLGLPMEAGPPPRGFGVPIRPVLTELFQGDAALPLAAWPNAAYGRVERPADVAADDKVTFRVAGRSGMEWRDEPDVRVLAYWFHDWAAQSYPVTVVPDGRASRTCQCGDAWCRCGV